MEDQRREKPRLPSLRFTTSCLCTLRLFIGTERGENHIATVAGAQPAMTTEEDR